MFQKRAKLAKKIKQILSFKKSFRKENLFLGISRTIYFIRKIEENLYQRINYLPFKKCKYSQNSSFK